MQTTGLLSTVPIGLIDNAGAPIQGGTGVLIRTSSWPPGPGARIIDVGIFDPWPAVIVSGTIFSCAVPSGPGSPTTQQLTPVDVEVITSFLSAKEVGLMTFSPNFADRNDVPMVDPNKQYNAFEIAGLVTAKKGQWGDVIKAVLAQVLRPGPTVFPIGLPQASNQITANSTPYIGFLQTNFRMRGSLLCRILGRPH